MKFLKRILNRNKIVWYSDIPSADKFISLKKFDPNMVDSIVDMLQNKDDEICIQLPTDFKYRIQISIWGENSSTCSIERVEPKKCSSYWLTASKADIKKLLSNIQSLADTPSKFGLILKKWE